MARRTQGIPHMAMKLEESVKLEDLLHYFLTSQSYSPSNKGDSSRVRPQTLDPPRTLAYIVPLAA